MFQVVQVLHKWMSIPGTQWVIWKSCCECHPWKRDEIHEFVHEGYWRTITNITDVIGLSHAANPSICENLNSSQWQSTLSLNSSHRNQHVITIFPSLNTCGLPSLFQDENVAQKSLWFTIVKDQEQIKVGPWLAYRPSDQIPKEARMMGLINFCWRWLFRRRC